jgi:hypothetical protein
LPDPEWLISRAQLESDGATWSLEYLAAKGLAIMFKPLFPSRHRNIGGRRTYPSVPGEYFSTSGAEIRRTPPQRRIDRRACWPVLINNVNRDIGSCAKAGRYSYAPHHPDSYNCVTWVSWTLQAAAGLNWYTAIAEYHSGPVDAGGGRSTTPYIILFETGTMSHARRWLHPFNSAP